MNIDEAKKKARKSEDTSNLESEDEQRRRKIRYRFTVFVRKPSSYCCYLIGKTGI